MQALFIDINQSVAHWRDRCTARSQPRTISSRAAEGIEGVKVRSMAQLRTTSSLLLQ